MWVKSYSKLFSDIERETVWRIWTDVNNWPDWHHDLEYCQMEGAFQKGNFFMLKPKGVRAFKIILTEVNPGYSFTDCTTFFGAKMYDTHTMEDTSEGIKITHTLKVTGPLKWLWIKLVAQNVANTVPDEMEALVQLARKQHG